MEKYRESLVDKVRNTYHSVLKRALYVPLIAVGLYGISSHSPLPSYSQGTRTTESEIEQDTAKPVLRNPQPNWSLNSTSGKLEMDDYGTQSGTLDYNIDDETFNFLAKDGRIEVTFTASDWSSDATRYGVTLGRDPINSTSVRFAINADIDSRYKDQNQFNISYFTPGYNATYLMGLTNAIIPNGTNRVSAEYNSSLTESRNDKDGNSIAPDGWSFGINGTIVGFIPSSLLPAMDIYPGIDGYDSSVGDDAVVNTVEFDNLTLEYNETPRQLQGGGGGKRIIKNALIGKGAGVTPHHIPSLFMRGDSNMDGAHDIADPINTLSYLYLGGASPKCPDSADVNDDGNIDISDAIFSLNHLFLGDERRIPPPNVEETGGKVFHDKAFGMDINADFLPKCNGYAPKEVVPIEKIPPEWR